MTHPLETLAGAGATFTLCAPLGKRPIHADWQNMPHTLEEVLEHLDAGGNAGLLTGAWSDWLVALDLDRLAAEFAKRYPGLIPYVVWRPNAPDRAKFIVKCNNAHNRKDKPTGLEILSTGSNAILWGTHETGAAVRTVIRGELPTLALDDLAALFQQWTGKPYGKRHEPKDAKRPDGCQAPTGSMFELAVLLDHLAPWRADDYNEWVRVGLAVKHVAGDQGLQVWDRWSARSAKYDPAETRRKWESFKPNGALSAETLAYWARQDGAQ